MATVGLPTTIPPLEQHEKLRLELQQKVRTMNESLLVVAEVCHEIVRERTWERFGYVSGREFFETEGPIAYRTVQRAVSIWQAYLAAAGSVGPGGHSEILRALEQIGTHKAAAIAPAICEDPEHWRDWIKDAEAMSIEAISEKSLLARGLQSKATAAADEKLLGYLLKHAPDNDFREEVEAVFRDGMVLAGTHSAWAVLIAMCREVRAEWRERVQRTQKGQANL